MTKDAKQVRFITLESPLDMPADQRAARDQQARRMLEHAIADAGETPVTAIRIEDHFYRLVPSSRVDEDGDMIPDRIPLPGREGADGMTTMYEVITRPTDNTGRSEPQTATVIAWDTDTHATPQEAIAHAHGEDGCE